MLQSENQGNQLYNSQILRLTLAQIADRIQHATSPSAQEAKMQPLRSEWRWCDVCQATLPKHPFHALWCDICNNWARLPHEELFSNRSATHGQYCKRHAARQLKELKEIEERETEYLIQQRKEWEAIPNCISCEHKQHIGRECRCLDAAGDTCGCPG